MLLQLDDLFRISCDSSKQNFQLEKLIDIEDRKSKEIKQEWKIIGFHGNSLGSVLKQYRNESLITADKLETLHNVLDALNEIDKTINKVVKRENIKLAAKEND